MSIRCYVRKYAQASWQARLGVSCMLVYAGILFNCEGARIQAFNLIVKVLFYISMYYTYAFVRIIHRQHTYTDIVCVVICIAFYNAISLNTICANTNTFL